MNLLDDILDSVLKSPPDLETALLNCVRMGRLLKVPELEIWARNEHNGYANGSDLPSYRIVRSVLLGNFFSGSAFQGWIHHTGRPVGYIQDLTSEVRQNMETLYIMEGVSVLKSLNDDGSMRQTLDSRVAKMVNAQLESGHCDQVYVPMPLGAYAGVLGNIRSKIVDFVMELQERFPDLDISPQAATGDLQETVREILYKFEIVAHTGAAVNVNAGSGTQTAMQQVTSNSTISNIESLFAALRDQGVDEDDLGELQGYLHDEEALHEFVEERGPIARWAHRAAGGVAGAGKRLSFEAIKLVMLELLKQYVLIKLGIGPLPPSDTPQVGS